MRVELQVIPDCPQTVDAYHLLRRALNELGLPEAVITTTVITDDEHARQTGFHGSPSFAVDGHDLFEADPTPTWSCRLYRTSNGMAPLPDIDHLRQQLSRAADPNQP
jgi:hypothetical protein